MEELRAAMKVLGFKQKHCNAIFTLLSTILLLGNIHFSDHNGHDASFEAAHITNRSVLDDVSELLGVPSDEMEQALTTRSRFVRNELVTSLLNAEAASVQRDGLMRDLYAVLFAFVVETANHKVSPGAEELFPMHIVQLDGPGFQSRSGSSVTGSPPAGHPNNFEEFTTNLVAEITHNWITRRTFDDSAAPSAEMSTDGIALPEIVTGDNTACVELLRGSIVGSAADRKPTGLLGAMDKTVHKVRTGKAAEENDATLLSELDQFAVHGSYVSSQAAPNQPARKVFGVNHYQGSCTYAIDGFVERDLDLFDSAFVQLLRRSVNSFVAKLFAGPSLATETHPLDPNTVVTAQVSARPLRRPTALRSGDAVGALLDAHKVYGVTRQLNATISEILETMAQAGQTWTVSCLRPNDISQPNSFDTRRVKSQIRSLLLPDVVARKRSEYVAGMSFQDFCLRYSSWVIPAATAAGVTEPKEKIQAFAIGNAWRESTDYSIGRDKVWLAFGAWRRMEDRLRATEPDDAPEAGREDDDVTAAGSPSYPPGQLARGGSYLTPTGEMGGDWGEGDLGTSKPAFGESADELLLRRPSNTSDPFRTPGEERSAGGGDSIMGWGSDWDKRAYGDINPGMVGTLEKDTGVTKAIDAVEEEPTTALRRWWVALTWLVTWWIPSYLLSRCGGMKRPDVQMAWREKVTICFLIFALCVIILFYILIFGKLLCPDSNKAWNEQQLGTHAAENDFYVAVQGKVYDITKFWKNQHSDITNLPVDDTTMLQLAGQDLTPYFPIPMTVGCPGLVTQQSFALQTNANYTPTITQAVHTSGSQQSDQSSKLADENWYPDRFVPKMQTYYKGFYVWKKGSVESLGQDGSKQWAIVDGSIYDLTNYFNTIEVTTGSGTGLQDPEFMDSTVTDLFRSQAGSDVSKDFHTAINSLNSTAQSATRNCLNNVFYAGKVDFRDSARCQVQNYLLLAFSALLVATLLAKFIAALQLTPKRNPEQQDKFVICQVWVSPSNLITTVLEILSV